MKPIGVFDSGFGGVSFLREALRLLPEEDYIYFGDNKNAPYGDKTEEEITEHSLESAEFLMKKGVKAVVVACNTATGTAIEKIRARLEVPVISMEPAIKPPCMKEGNGRILMLATKATTTLERYLALKQRMPNPERIADVPCSGLVDRIEKGVFIERGFDDLLSEYLSPYEGETVDAIVLGCTHYVFISDEIRRYAKEHFSGECALFDGNEGTAHQLDRVLTANGIRKTAGIGTAEFYTSGDYSECRRIFDMLMAKTERR